MGGPPSHVPAAKNPPTAGTSCCRALENSASPQCRVRPLAVSGRPDPHRLVARRNQSFYPPHVQAPKSVSALHPTLSTYLTLGSARLPGWTNIHSIATKRHSSVCANPTQTDSSIFCRPLPPAAVAQHNGQMAPVSYRVPRGDDSWLQWPGRCLWLSDGDTTMTADDTAARAPMGFGFLP